jgi:hypothetical protein
MPDGTKTIFITVSLNEHKVMWDQKGGDQKDAQSWKDFFTGLARDARERGRF